MQSLVVLSCSCSFFAFSSGLLAEILLQLVVELVSWDCYKLRLTKCRTVEDRKEWNGGLWFVTRSRERAYQIE